MMRRLCNDAEFTRFHKSDHNAAHEVEDFIAELSYHRRVVADLLQRSADTCELVRTKIYRKCKSAKEEQLTSILQYRAGISTLDSTSTLVKIASQGEEDRRVAQKTSVNAASLTFAATVYLPASLLSVRCALSIIWRTILKRVDLLTYDL